MYYLGVLYGGWSGVQVILDVGEKKEATCLL